MPRTAFKKIILKLPSNVIDSTSNQEEESVKLLRLKAKVIDRTLLFITKTDRKFLIMEE